MVQLHVLIDLATLQSGLHANSVCELADGTPLPVSVVRQMACEAEIIPVVLGGDGRALDIGRGCSTGNRSPAPGVAGDAPHLHPARLRRCRSTIVGSITSSRGNTEGATDLPNLAPLCESRKHHHDVHEGGWQTDR